MGGYPMVVYKIRYHLNYSPIFHTRTFKDKAKLRKFVEKYEYKNILFSIWEE